MLAAALKGESLVRLYEIFTSIECVVKQILQLFRHFRAAESNRIGRLLFIATDLPLEPNQAFDYLKKKH